MDVVKRPRGRPPLPETLRRRLEKQREQHSRSAAQSAKKPSSPVNEDNLQTARTPVSTSGNSANSSLEEQPVVVKKRRKQGPRGMARLFVNRLGSKVNGSAKPSFRSPQNTTELFPLKHRETETLSESPSVEKLQIMERCEQPMELAAEQVMMPSLSSPIWQPASKRVLDAVCVTDVTACSGVTVTVRESSVVDGFFRSRLEEPL